MTHAAGPSMKLLVCHKTADRIRVRVPALRSRPAAADSLQWRLAREPCFTSVRTRPTTGSLIVYFDAKAMRPEEVLGTLEKALAGLENGFFDTPASDDRRTVLHPSRSGLWRLIALTGLTVYHLLKTFVLKSPLSSGWSTFMVLFGGYALFRRALSDLGRGKLLSANTFLSGATILASVTGEAAAALEVLWIQEIGQLLEDSVQARSRRAIRDVILVSPKTAFVWIDGAETEVPVESIQAGCVLRLHGTDRIPVDGTVLEGEGLLDESHITGRAEPERKTKGDAVFAGTTVQQGRLSIRADKVGRDTYLAQVTRMVESSLAQKTAAEKQADKLAARLLGFGLAASAATYLGTGSWIKTLAVQLALASPCATVLAASTAVTAALASAAKNRVLIKGGVYLERMAAVDCVCFDKTGTLTEALPRVEAVVSRTPGITRDRILAMAAAAQSRNVHPIARALTQAAPSGTWTAPDAAACETILGRGVVAEVAGGRLTVGNRAMMADQSVDVRYFERAANRLASDGCTVVYVARNGKAQGLVGLKYDVKPRSRQLVAQLREAGFSELHLVSGDSGDAVTRTARDLGLSRYHGDMLPEDKSRYVAQLVSDGKNVVMVGDGINDAPALAQADIGIAMGAGGAEAAIEAADIALIDNRLDRILFVRRLSRKTLRLIAQNHWFAVITDLAGAALAAGGFLPPMLSGIAHIAHTAVIFVNSSRLLAERHEDISHSA
jgi:cation-transporting P-type ATPase C